MIKLRDDQLKLVSDVRQKMSDGHRSVLVQAVTGSGKTIIASHIIENAIAKNKVIWFCCHRKELIYQTAEALDKFNVPYGYIAAGMPYDARYSVHIASVPTLYKRMNKVKSPDLIIWDETHFIGAKTWTDIYKANPQAYHIGLSATPCRLDGIGLKDYYSSLILGPSYTELMELGNISKYKAYAPAVPDLSGVHTRMGDYKMDELFDAMNKPKLIGDAVNEYKKLADGKRAIIFAVNIEHSQAITSEFKKAGISADHVDGFNDSYTRKKIIDNFRSGHTKVISNVNLLTTGFDLPAIEACILMRPTQSLSLYLQQVGRALRPYPGKDHAILLDHAGLFMKFGLPDDEREWTLEGAKKKLKEKDAIGPVKICPSCFSAVRSFNTFCTTCGHQFAVKERSGPEQVDGNLEEVDRDKLKKARKMEQSKARTLEELIELGKSRGYKNAGFWAQQVVKSRGNKR